jgi:hypothetical protein
MVSRANIAVHRSTRRASLLGPAGTTVIVLYAIVYFMCRYLLATAKLMRAARLTTGIDRQDVLT